MKQLKKIAFITSTCALIFGHVPDVWASSNNEISEVVQQSQAITGVVVDSNGEPIIGANVVEKGTTNGIITDFDGNFLYWLSNFGSGHKQSKRLKDYIERRHRTFG